MTTMSQPKTPSRHRSRSEVKTPLTLSLVSAPNSSSHYTPGSNPFKRSNSHSNHKTHADNLFVSKSRPVSPIKRATTGALTVSDNLSRQASGGVIRKGGVESRLDVVTRDYVPPPQPKQQEIKRSKSTSAVVRHKQTCLKF